MWRIVIALATVLPAGLFLFTALRRVFYPFELEWMEGAMVDLVARVTRGEALYQAPSLDFVPFIYPPLYVHVCAMFSRLFGSGFTALRLVSLAATIGTAVFLGAVVRRETGSRFWSWVAAGTWLGTFGMGGFWMDLGRVDSLFLFLNVAGLFLPRLSPTATGAGVAGLLLAAAFHTKQTAALVVLPMLTLGWLALPLRHWGWLVGAFGLAAGLPAVYWQSATDGWYGFFVFSLPRQHVFEMLSLGEVLLEDLVAMSPAAALGVFFFLRPPPGLPPGSRRFHALAAIGLVGAAWQSYLHLGSYRNVLLPAGAGLSLLGAMGGSSLEVLAGEPPADASSRDRQLAWGGKSLLVLVFLVQMWRLWFDPFPLLPTESDQRGGERFLRLLREQPGRILLPYHGAYLSAVGKAPCAHHMALCDVLRGGEGLARRLLLEDFGRALKENRYPTVIRDEPWFPDITDQVYSRVEPISWTGSEFLPPVGMRVRPEAIARRAPVKPAAMPPGGP